MALNLWPYFWDQGKGSRRIEVFIDGSVSSLELNGEPVHFGWGGYVRYRFDGSGFRAKAVSPEGVWESDFEVPERSRICA